MFLKNMVFKGHTMEIKMERWNEKGWGKSDLI